MRKSTSSAVVAMSMLGILAAGASSANASTPTCGTWMNTGLAGVKTQACIYTAPGFKHALVRVWNGNSSERFIYNVFATVDTLYGSRKCSPGWMAPGQTSDCWSAPVPDPAGSNFAAGSVEWSSWQFTYVTSPAVA